MSKRYPILLVLLGAIACQSSPEPTGPFAAAEGAVCKPLESKQCHCGDSNKTLSAQYCSYDGTAWGECACCGENGLECTGNAVDCASALPWEDGAVPYFHKGTLHEIARDAVYRYDCEAGLRVRLASHPLTASATSAEDTRKPTPRLAPVTFSDGSLAVARRDKVLLVDADGATTDIEFGGADSLAIDGVDRLFLRKPGYGCANNLERVVALGRDGMYLAEPQCMGSDDLRTVGGNVVRVSTGGSWRVSELLLGSGELGYGEVLATGGEGINVRYSAPSTDLDDLVVSGSHISGGEPVDGFIEIWDVGTTSLLWSSEVMRPSGVDGATVGKLTALQFGETGEAYWALIHVDRALGAVFTLGDTEVASSHLIATFDKANGALLGVIPNTQGDIAVDASNALLVPVREQWVNGAPYKLGRFLTDGTRTN